MSISQLEYQQMLARTAPKPQPAQSGVERESDLHAQIMDYCRQRGWLFFHGMMSERTHRTKGEPDFIILRENADLILVECKSRIGKLSTEQQAISAHAQKLGHTIHVVRSMDEFKQLAQ